MVAWIALIVAVIALVRRSHSAQVADLQERIKTLEAEFEELRSHQVDEEIVDEMDRLEMDDDAGK